MCVERVFDVRRDDRKHLAIDNSVAFEFAKLLRQHFLRCRWNGAAQFAEPLGAFSQVKENNRLPFAADHLHRRTYRAFVRIHVGFVLETN